ncbi:hypothetical protein [Pontibacter actiniarum]|uniref:Lipoprotein n=1 Tax=Pontibacter actiniarum TaxID=323450 RepID=A0A1X9YPQ4_9BACT|nr:hypothetical protein [Pontibacter actiniarum]ARS34814.1 hypothetical protein CA264_04800 [Pontibacter actiniarum]
MHKEIKKHLAPYLLLLPLALVGCQEKANHEGGLASTHPELAEELAEDTLTVPYSDTAGTKLYDRYRITTEQYLNSGNYSAGSMYRGKLAPLDESSHSDARTYRTMLREGMAEGVNFAAKYTLVTVGCGTGCQQHVVVDRETGKVLDKVQSSMGARYSEDSRLLIVNPPDSTVDYSQCNGCAPEAYVFENGRFRKLEQTPN